MSTIGYQYATDGGGVSSLAGHTVLVTGGAGDGVGAGICDAVAEAGGRLVINDQDAAAVEAAAARYPGAVGLAADISDPDQVEAMLGEAARRCGPVTALVNNAGVGLSAPFYEASTADFDRVFDIDVRGMWHASRAFVTRLIADGLPGSILHVSSVHAHSTMQRYATYAGAKSAVEGLTRGMAVELGPFGITCNAIAPGYVHSEQNVGLLASFTPDPAGWVAEHTRREQAIPHLITPLDCGRAAVFLLAARCITGQVLAVDAGLTAMIYRRPEPAASYAGGAR